jgi:hypothetical protein
LGRCETYITPSTTSGVACQVPDTPDWYIHFCSRFFAFAGVIWSSPLCRWLMYDPE